MASKYKETILIKAVQSALSNPALSRPDNFGKFMEGIMRKLVDSPEDTEIERELVKQKIKKDSERDIER